MTSYREILAELERDILSGVRPPGEKLSPQREFAWRRGCSVGTVTRAYKELERLGLAEGQVGRGTFVLGPGAAADAVEVMPRHCVEEVGAGEIDFSVNISKSPEVSAAIAKAMGRASSSAGPEAYTDYFDARARSEDRATATQLLESLGRPARAEEIIIAPGAQAALFASVLSFAGDAPVALEELGYPGFRAAVAAAGKRVHALEIDEHGICPEGFARACVEHGVKMLITSPTAQNPTGATQPEDRRRAIVDLARAHGVVIVEDGVYDYLNPNAPPGYRELAPDCSVYVTSYSKIAGPALRVAYAWSSPALAARLGRTVTAVNWMTSAILLDIAREIVRNGAVARLAEKLRAEAAWRQQEMMRRFADKIAPAGAWRSDNGGADRAGARIAKETPSDGFLRCHFWLKLPDDAHPAAFAEAAHGRGLKIAPAGVFAARRNVRADAYRVATMAVSDRSVFLHGLDVLAHFYDDQPCVEMACV